MDFKGKINANCPPECVFEVLDDPDALARLLPEGSKVEKSGDGQFTFTLIRTLGPIRLTLPGKMAVTQGEGALDRKLSIRAAHVIGGKVDAELEMVNSVEAGALHMAYAVNLEATGLAGRIAKEHRGRLGGLLKSGMMRLKFLAEARHNKEG